MESNRIRTVWLRYKGVCYKPDNRVTDDKRLYRRLKSIWKVGRLKGMRKWKLVPLHARPDGYEMWYPKHPITGKHHPGIIVSRAVLESFEGGRADVAGLVAAHGPGTKRSDGALGACSFKSIKENRADRKRDGTDSTGNGTIRGKLKHVEAEIVDARLSKTSIRKLAERFLVSRTAIRSLLRKYGLK